MRTVIIILLTTTLANAQVGGTSSFNFLNQPNNARVSALGGHNVTLYDDDVNQFYNNPGLLNPEMNNRLGMNFQPYFAGINYFTLNYATEIGKTGVWGFGVNYMDYGRFESYDNAGNMGENFGASDYVVTASKSHRLGDYSLGTNIKFAGSQISGYNAFAGLIDFGGVYMHPNSDLQIGLVMKNLGFRFSNYTPAHEIKLPFDVQAGLSYKPKEMPIRATVTAHTLDRGNIVFADPAKFRKFDIEGNEIPYKVTFFNKVMTHLSFGAEFLIHKNFEVRAGYNHQRRQELRLEATSGGAGFSLGGVVRMKGFEFAYTRAFYHVAGGNSYISLITDFNKIFNKKGVSSNLEF